MFQLIKYELAWTLKKNLLKRFKAQPFQRSCKKVVEVFVQPKSSQKEIVFSEKVRNDNGSIMTNYI
jgi:hypothetical protein